MVQKSCDHHLGCMKPYGCWDIYYINWLAGFLNHQQYQSLNLSKREFLFLSCWLKHILLLKSTIKQLFQVLGKGSMCHFRYLNILVVLFNIRLVSYHCWTSHEQLQVFHQSWTASPIFWASLLQQSLGSHRVLRPTVLRPLFGCHERRVWCFHWRGVDGFLGKPTVGSGNAARWWQLKHVVCSSLFGEDAPIFEEHIFSNGPPTRLFLNVSQNFKAYGRWLMPATRSCGASPLRQDRMPYWYAMISPVKESYHDWVVILKMFLCSPLFGEMIQFWRAYFPDGLLNHQLDQISWVKIGVTLTIFANLCQSMLPVTYWVKKGRHSRNHGSLEVFWIYSSYTQGCFDFFVEKNTKLRLFF